MKILWHTPYKQDGGERYPDPVWPEGWPLPNKGDVVNIEDQSLWVRAIEFNPFGDGEDPDPYIYIVLADTPNR